MSSIVVDGKEFAQKRYTWDELVKDFPEKWVILKDATVVKSSIKDGILVDVCEDEQIDDRSLEFIEKGLDYYYARTTYDPFSLGILGVN